MKRYTIEADSVPGNDTWADAPCLDIQEAVNGEWIRYEDALLLERTLRKYIEHVGECEGADYVDDRFRNGRYGDGVQFTDEEWTLLKTIAGRSV